MKEFTKKIITLTLMTLPSLGLAQSPTVPGLPQTNVRNLGDVSQIVVTLVGWITGLFFVAAIVFLFYAAFLFFFAAGDPEKLIKAKNQLIYSIIAIAVALLAGSIRYIVENILK